jgi:hypothetical protein
VGILTPPASCGHATYEQRLSNAVYRPEKQNTPKPALVNSLAAILTGRREATGGYLAELVAAGRASFDSVSNAPRTSGSAETSDRARLLATSELDPINASRDIARTNAAFVGGPYCSRSMSRRVQMIYLPYAAFID